MLPMEREIIRQELERFSQEQTLWGRTCRVVDWDALSQARLGRPEHFSFWCYYNDEPAHEFFDDLMASGLVHYYAAPRECYSPITGFDQAIEAGKRYILLEDMS